MNLFDDNGFLIVRAQVPVVLCDALVQTFKEEVKPYDGVLDRFGEQPGPHRFDKEGRIENPLSSVHKLDPVRFPGFAYASGMFYQDAGLLERAVELAGVSLALGQSFFFERGRGTRAHQDMYFSPKRKAVAAFAALQDITIRDGALFVCPGSNRVHIPWPILERPYIEGIAELIARGELKRYAPELKKGDVVYFDGLTVHGSHFGKEETTRYSLTAHFATTD